MSVWINVDALKQDIEETLREHLKGSPAGNMLPVLIHTLAKLYQEDGQHASSLAKSVGRAATSFTPLLDKLEGAKYIRRQADSSDRRAVRIFLTKEGAALRGCITEALGKLEAMYPEVSLKLDEPVPYEVANA